MSQWTKVLDGPIRWQARAWLDPVRIRSDPPEKVTLEELAGGIGSMTALFVCSKVTCNTVQSGSVEAEEA